jgi:hypothetical protein
MTALLQNAVVTSFSSCELVEYDSEFANLRNPEFVRRQEAAVGRYVFHV